jgi:AcrR family transcriptional regulator
MTRWSYRWETAVPTNTWTNLDPGRRERILEAAMAEFGRHGYSGGNLGVIAREAGVAKGSLFQYFENKFDLFAHVTEQVSLRVYTHMAPWLTGLDPHRSFFEFLTDAVESWVDYFATHPLERGVTAATTLEVDPVVRAAVRGVVHRIYLEGLRPLLEQARARGELHPDIDLDACLSLLVLLFPHLAVAPFEPALDPLLYGKGPAELRESVRRIVAGVFGGFGPLPDHVRGIGSVAAADDRRA